MVSRSAAADQVVLSPFECRQHPHVEVAARQLPGRQRRRSTGEADSGEKETHGRADPQGDRQYRQRHARQLQLTEETRLARTGPMTTW